MKVIFYIILFPLFLWGVYSCSTDKKTRISVKYKVFIDSKQPCCVFVSYKDSTGYVTLYVDDNWSKEVFLPQGEVASLLMICQYDIEDGLQTGVFFHSLTGQIDNGKEVVTDSGENIVSISTITRDT
ncbi:hypothetical protein [uncultured Dysgonomonas sp.]|uniref:Uncharacterized protein n=1 Tax=uncultured Dysgonomonas sp. TaxID=206096 RepID=A0A212JY66_9BACT|nr:hypothetical protein [uncultured Dysgonomonas sp.]SBW04318.1 conserved hypothetical protein [uncultured Dysgonomonas sp.]